MMLTDRGRPRLRLRRPESHAGRAGVSVVAQAAAVDEEEIKHSFRAAGLQADEVSKRWAS